MFAIAEHVAGARKLLRPHTMDVRRVRNLDDFVDLHHVATDARETAIGLVVGEDVAAVAGAVCERQVRVMQVAVIVQSTTRFQKLLRWRQQALGQVLAIVGQAQPVALSRLKTGMCMSSRPDGMARMRTSPV